MKRISILLSTLAACVGVVFPALAQIPVPPPAPEVQLRSGPELDQMLGPIALYPDPLIAQILPAATLPSEIVLADRYVNGGGDPNLIDQQPWDPSVQALARYPALLNWLDENLAWTTAVGQAFLYQPQDVMDSIQRLRAQAQALGNLQSTPQDNVVIDDGTIEILPANPEVIYLPVYQPSVVYFQRAYGTPFISFGIGCAIGTWLNHDFDWHDHHLIVWGHDQPRPANWWFRRPVERPKAEAAHATVWQPRDRPEVGARGLDRGWASHPAPSTVTAIGGQSRPAPAPVSRPASGAPARNTVTVIGGQPKPAPASPSRPASGAPARSTVTVIGGQPRPAPASPSRPATGALIGVQSAHETQQFSTRGQESRQETTSRPASPAPHAAAPAHSEAPSHPAGGGKR